jgi:hypothetical protein
MSVTTRSRFMSERARDASTTYEVESISLPATGPNLDDEGGAR